MKTSVSVKALRAILIAAAKKDVRYYLNGALIETDAAGALLVSTDGHRLHACRSHDAATIPGAPIIIPRDMLETVIRGASKDAMAEISAEAYAGMSAPTVPHTVRIERSDGMTITGAAVDGTFPDFRRVIPSLNSFSNEPAQFNPLLIADAEKAALLMAGYARRVAIFVRHNGNGSALVTSKDAPEFLAVVMPRRSEA